MRTNAEWLEWGKRDPLWGVATWKGRDKGGSRPWTDEEFYALGEDWHMYAAAWRASIGYESGTVLEIGCGAGRITQMLAREFSGVVAIDVSPDVIAYGRSRVANPNIVWRVGDGDALPAEDASVNAVFSCLVFQHFPDNAAQLATFAEVFRVLKPGGTFFVQMPVHNFPGGRFAKAARAAYTLSQHFRNRAKMRMTSYEIGLLTRDLGALGFENVGISFLNKASFAAYGRKPLHSAVRR